LVINNAGIFLEVCSSSKQVLTKKAQERNHGGKVSQLFNEYKMDDQMKENSCLIFPSTIHFLVLCFSLSTVCFKF
jgi:hypothetical protein